MFFDTKDEDLPKDMYITEKDRMGYIIIFNPFNFEDTYGRATNSITSMFGENAIPYLIPST